MSAHWVNDFARWLDECTEGVSRRGEYEPCGKTPVALRVDPESGKPYSVCASHVRGQMVPIVKLLEWAKGAAPSEAP